jgi:hypothetical protein
MAAKVSPTYIVGRGRSGRPTTQHIAAGFDRTACGIWVGGWNVWYSSRPIRVIQCYRCLMTVK